MMIAKVPVKMIIGGPLVRRAREKEVQKMIVVFPLGLLRLWKTASAQTVLKNSSVASVTDILAKIGIKIVVLKITRLKNATLDPNSFLPHKKTTK